VSIAPPPIRVSVGRPTPEFGRVVVLGELGELLAVDVLQVVLDGLLVSLQRLSVPVL